MADLFKPSRRRAAQRSAVRAVESGATKARGSFGAIATSAARGLKAHGAAPASPALTPATKAKAKAEAKARADARTAARAHRTAAALEATAARLDQRVAIVDRKHAKATAKTAKAKAAQARLDAKSEARVTKAGPLSVIDALGFFLLAGVIVAKGLDERRGAGGVRGWLASTPIHEEQAALAAGREPGRGRDARGPHEIPARGWRDILSRTWTEFNQDQIMTVAGGVTFFTLLSLFPAMAAFVSLYGLFFDVNKAMQELASLGGVLPRDTLNFIAGEIQRLAQARSSGLSVAFVAGLLISVWSANGAVKAVFYGLNVAYEEHERRSFIKLNLMSLAFTLGALAFVMLTFAAVVAVPVILAYVGLGGAGAALALLRWPILLAVTVVGLSVLYRFGPSRQRPKWRWITPGSLLAAVLWLIASWAFSIYVSSFGHFNKTYGSLGAVIGFMTWIWYSSTIVLFGAELNAEIEHQTAVDTTSGHPNAMGARGAHVADTLGPIRGAKPAPAPLGA